MYRPDAEFPVYCHGCWWSDKWNPLDYGQDYDFNVPFFEQFNELQNKVPHAASYETKNESCSYCNFATHNKGCYLLFGSWFNENSGYSQTLLESKECWDCMYVKKSELCLSSADLVQCSQVHFSVNCTNCIDSAFLYDCRNCQNCLFSWNLRNKNYYAFNRQVSKEEFAKIKKEMLGSQFAFQKNLTEFRKSIQEKALHKFMAGERNHNVSGELLYGCKNVHDSFYIHDGENEKFAVRGGVGQKDSMDVFGVHSGELIYECNSVDFSSRCYFGTNAENNVNAVYALDCEHVNNIFGCMGLRKKDYCILNKQYSKEEFEAPKEKIINQMNEKPFIDTKGKVYKYGEFFPADLCPHAYNESIAQEWIPLEKEAAQELGYVWNKDEEKSYTPTKSWKELPEDIEKVDDSILSEIILCQAWDIDKDSAKKHKCTKAFRIIENELITYKRFGLPLPRKCPNTRYFELSELRNKPNFWHRSCMCELENHSMHQGSKCQNEFETSYSPDRPEMVYCETCYQQEIY
ncbi:hypothetical protein HYW73_03780 [Candidatus Nomurabacteria bacterium]|nr:hypothetical protein [Candidatus Nomurabacteria bacterium]